jgi:hypothetical protein
MNDKKKRQIHTFTSLSGTRVIKTEYQLLSSPGVEIAIIDRLFWVSIGITFFRNCSSSMNAASSMMIRSGAIPRAAVHGQRGNDQDITIHKIDHKAKSG